MKKRILVSLAGALFPLLFTGAVVLYHVPAWIVVSLMMGSLLFAFLFIGPWWGDDDV